jgi:hypothetical protein
MWSLRTTDNNHHKFDFGSISSPNICASVFGLKLTHMHGLV